MNEITVCAIVGCTHTTRRYPEMRPGWWICAKHWCRHCPPRSRRRRAYHAFFAQAKRHGWGFKGTDGKSARLDYRFWSFWDRLVRVANTAEAKGHLDIAEINALFGWADE